LAGEDVLHEVLAMNANTTFPVSEFDPGHVTPLEFDFDRIAKTESGFVIHLPSQSPIPTPTVYQNRLYVSGGFSSQEFYCFDARTGEFIWGAQLDDDGPSSAVPYEDSIIFGCESCTVFSLAADTGEMRWSHWLGDPLLSMPTLADGRVFVVYPSMSGLPANEPDGTDIRTGDTMSLADDVDGSRRTVIPTHVAAAFDAMTGKLLWRRWLDSDCMTAPVAVEEKLFLATLAGTVYEFRQRDGQIQRAERMRATSAPVVVGDDLYLTRRADDRSQPEVAECIAVHRLSTNALHFAAARRSAPYLDEAIQRQAQYSKDAYNFETQNAIGGGFGGGFGGGGGSFFVADDPFEQADENSNASDGNSISARDKTGGPSDDVDRSDLNDAAQSSDPLARTELQAAATIGLGNVSTIQSFHGSRILYWDGRLFNCMGDRVVCTVAETGETMWSHTVSGDLSKTGGHLAATPIAAGRFLFVATVEGSVIQLDRESGEICRTFKLDAALRFPPVLQDGRIYLGTQDGRVVCIDTGDRDLTGWPVWGGDPGHRNTVSAQ
jgi:outer membrane protein assembly factor BamB